MSTGLPCASTVERRKNRGARGGYVYLPSASTDSVGSPPPKRCPTNDPLSQLRSVTGREPASLLGARHQRITPYTPRHNGEVERYNGSPPKSSSVPAAGSARTSAVSPLVSGTSTPTITGHRPHGAAGRIPPAQRLRAGLTKRPVLIQPVVGAEAVKL